MRRTRSLMRRWIRTRLSAVSVGEKSVSVEPKRIANSSWRKKPPSGTPPLPS